LFISKSTVLFATGEKVRNGGRVLYVKRTPGRNFNRMVAVEAVGDLQNDLASDFGKRLANDLAKTWQTPRRLGAADSLGRRWQQERLSCG
jgi:hypothetical protein